MKTPEQPYPTVARVAGLAAVPPTCSGDDDLSGQGGHR
jgi:hypothetical protein